MFATLLATTSICRSSTTCRDSPTRSVFCIGGSPLVRRPAYRLSQAGEADHDEPIWLSQASGFAVFSAKAVPNGKMSENEGVRRFAGSRTGRQKGLVDHVCPAVFS